MAGIAAYSASKFAIVGLTQAMAKEVGPHGITVNAICPGRIETWRPSPDEESMAKEEGIPGRSCTSATSLGS